jgi:ubiquinone/menaquinone biosynthesis C-methylase UbiE
MKRTVAPEILDTLSPDDPRALRSRRDLRRVNAWMGNHSIMVRALENNFNGSAPKQIAELGAGDGNFLLRVAQKINSPNVNATLLDRKKNVSAGTLAAFSKLGWRAEAVVADVFNWPQTETEIVIANLFIHHFQDAELKELFRIIAARAKLFIAVEPHRFHFPVSLRANAPLHRLRQNHAA